MNNRSLTLSLVVAGLAVFFVQSYVSSIEDSVNKRFGTEILVVTAKRDIQEMETIDETALELKSIPKKFLQPAAISTEKDTKENTTSSLIRSVAGSVALVPLKMGEQITFNKIVDIGSKTGLSPQIAPGKRAVSINIQEQHAVSKLIKPGDRVDIIFVGDLGSGKTSKIAKTLMQDVVILSIGKLIQNNIPRVIEKDPIAKTERVHSLSEDFNFNTITLEVDPIQAQILSLISATSETNLILSLRNNDDNQRIALPTLGFREILGGDFDRVTTPSTR